MQRTILQRYGVGVLVALVAGVCQYWLQPLVDQRFPFAIFPLAVLAASWMGGLGPGLVATAACTFTILYFPGHPEAGHTSTRVLLLLVLAGLLITTGISRLRRETARAQRSQAEADAQLGTTEQLYQLSSALSRAETPAEVMATCLSEIGHAVDAAAGAAFLVSADATACELSQKVGYPELRVGSAVPYPIGGNSPLNEAIRCHELVVVPSDIPRQANHGRAAAHTVPQLHEGDITVPLMSGSRALGAIVVALEGRVLRSEQRQFLLAAGRQTGQALDRARSYETGRARPCGGRSDAPAR